MAYHFDKLTIETGIQLIELLVQLIMIQPLVFTREIIILFKADAPAWQVHDVL